MRLPKPKTPNAVNLILRNNLDVRKNKTSNKTSNEVFTKDFRFELAKEEYDDLRFQNGTSNEEQEINMSESVNNRFSIKYEFIDDTRETELSMYMM